MSRKTYKPEQIIGMLREAEVRLSQGATVGEVCLFHSPNCREYRIGQLKDQ